MEDLSHLKLIAMSLLQTCSYVTEQMQTPVTIDLNKFMEAFSITRADGTEVRPPSWKAEEDNSISISTTISHLTPESQSSSFTTPKPLTMEDYRLIRQTEAIRWIDLQEKRASIIARLQPVRPEEYQERRDAVKTDSGPLRRKGMKFCYHTKQNIIKYFYSPKKNNRANSKIQNRRQTWQPSKNIEKSYGFSQST